MGAGFELGRDREMASVELEIHVEGIVQRPQKTTAEHNHDTTNQEM